MCTLGPRCHVTSYLRNSGLTEALHIPISVLLGLVECEAQCPISLSFGLGLFFEGFQLGFLVSFHYLGIP
jgi:hypothetical protein